MARLHLLALRQPPAGWSINGAVHCRDCIGLKEAGGSGGGYIFCRTDKRQLDLVVETENLAIVQWFREAVALATQLSVPDLVTHWHLLEARQSLCLNCLVEGQVHKPCFLFNNADQCPAHGACAVNAQLRCLCVAGAQPRSPTLAPAQLVERVATAMIDNKTDMLMLRRLGALVEQITSLPRRPSQDVRLSQDIDTLRLQGPFALSSASAIQMKHLIELDPKIELRTGEQRVSAARGC